MEGQFVSGSGILRNGLERRLFYSKADARRKEKGVGSAPLPPSPSQFTLAFSGGIDCSDVDLLHLHHGIKSSFGLCASGRHRLGQRARGDLP